MPHTHRLRETGVTNSIDQLAFGADSVFNFYRPGFRKTGSHTGEAGLLAPELQITHTSSVGGYFDFMFFLVAGNFEKDHGFAQTFAEFAAVADDPDKLIDQLDTLLVHGRLSPDTRARITAMLEQKPIREGDKAASDRNARATLATLFVVTSPEFMVQN